MSAIQRANRPQNSLYASRRSNGVPSFSLETLEQRAMLAANAWLSSGNLYIVADSYGGSVEISTNWPDATSTSRYQSANNYAISAAAIGSASNTWGWSIGSPSLAVTGVSPNGNIHRNFDMSTIDQIFFFGSSDSDLVTNHTSVPSTMYGFGGDDVLVGGAARDRLYGGNDHDKLRGNGGDDDLQGGSGNDVIHGDSGNDVLSGDSGNDKLFAGSGRDYLHGGSNDDVLVSIDGDATDHLFGNSGNDSFWIDREVAWIFSATDKVRDASAFELSNNVHEVQRFENGDKSLDGDDLADPVDGRFYKDFSDRPLFADAGPSSLDMRQGAQADCWLISAMGSIAKADPNRIRQTVVDLGDGTYGVQLAGKFYRVDGDLPTDGPTTSNLVNAGFGQQNSIWLPIIEKAYTFKTVLTFAPPGTAAVYAMGGADTSLVYGDLGMSVDSLAATSASTTLFYLASQLRVGRAVTLYINTPAANCPCIGNHFYVVERVNFQGGRPVSVVLRNPWGRDGAGSDGLNDGLVTVSGNQLVASGAVVRSATV